MNDSVQKLILDLDLQPHPEGGFYRETYRSGPQVKSPVHGQMRSAVTDIYYLLPAGQISRFHRVAHDEIWHFYKGEALELVELDPDSFEITRTVLGRDAVYKQVIRGGHWQAARPLGAYALVGCTVAPGFDFADFQFLRDDEPARARFSNLHPDIKQLL